MNPFQLIGLSVTCSKSKYFTTARRLCIAVLSSLCSVPGLQPAASLPRGARGEPGCSGEQVWLLGSGVGFSARERGWREETVGKVTFDQIGLVGFINLEVSRDVLSAGLGRVMTFLQKFSYVDNCVLGGNGGEGTLVPSPAPFAMMPAAGARFSVLGTSGAEDWRNSAQLCPRAGVGQAMLQVEVVKLWVGLPGAP